MQVTVIVPTYNEKENIEALVTQLLALPTGVRAHPVRAHPVRAQDVRIIIVDDNSPDGTGEIADQLAQRSEGRVGVVHRASKLGLGTAYIAGFKRALADGADLICTMDADYSHNPRYIPGMVEKIGQGYDLVIGSRYVRGGGSNHNLVRKVFSWGANMITRVMLGLHARDTTAGFRCYRREVLESLDLDSIKSSGYSFLFEMLFSVERRGWRVGEVPIFYEDRLLGASKISKSEIIESLRTVLRLARTRLTRRAA